MKRTRKQAYWFLAIGVFLAFATYYKREDPYDEFYGAAFVLGLTLVFAGGFYLAETNTDYRDSN